MMQVGNQVYYFFYLLIVNSFMTTGEKHFKFWTVCGRNLRSYYANFKGDYEI